MFNVISVIESYITDWQQELLANEVILNKLDKDGYSNLPGRSILTFFTYRDVIDRNIIILRRNLILYGQRLNEARKEID